MIFSVPGGYEEVTFRVRELKLRDCGLPAQLRLPFLRFALDAPDLVALAMNEEEHADGAEGWRDDKDQNAIAESLNHPLT